MSKFVVADSVDEGKVWDETDSLEEAENLAAGYIRVGYQAISIFKEIDYSIKVIADKG